MTRFLIIFAITLGISFALMASVLTQNGYSMFAPEMQTMIAVCIAVALYVAWRISNVLRRRQEDAVPGADGGKKPVAFGLGSLTGGKSRALREREARVAARRRRLIQEGKLQEEEPATPEPQLAAEAAPQPDAPTRAASTATMKEKMAARAERVRRAREEGKI